RGKSYFVHDKIPPAVRGGGTERHRGRRWIDRRNPSGATPRVWTLPTSTNRHAKKRRGNHRVKTGAAAIRRRRGRHTRVPYNFHPRLHSEIGASIYRSHRDSGGGQREGGQSNQHPDSVASVGIHHHPEFYAPLQCADQLHHRGSRRGRSLAAGNAVENRR